MNPKFVLFVGKITFAHSTALSKLTSPIIYVAGKYLIVVHVSDFSIEESSCSEINAGMILDKLLHLIFVSWIEFK